MYKFVIFFFFFINLNLVAQNIDETIFLADKMFEKKEYRASIELYKRTIFFSETNRKYLYEKSGDSYFLIQDYENAFISYDSASKYSVNENSLMELNFKKVDCLIFSENYNEAEDLLLSIPFPFNEKQKQKENFYLGLINFANSDFEKSEQFFTSAVSDSSTIIKSNIQEIFNKKRYLKNPNPKIAGILSLILPGSGQLYAGDYKNAINSFLLVAVFGAIGTDMYIRYAWYDSLISVFPWFYRYYSGGAKNAVNIAELKQSERRNKKLNEIIILIQDDWIPVQTQTEDLK